ncbi:glycosyltransferase family 4 protein [Paenibacillus campi]|uniref:glycosyltransferase family 4 protein n=1 Tax=Paenibacillus campi TaxID=3106031 RepID=UPI002AFFB2D2|nr:glycosyltransferase family 4 protein [Paenibacillus sp. SGZ-1014]
MPTKSIAYVAPYVNSELQQKRGYSAKHTAGNKKIDCILHALEAGGNDITVISPLLLKRGTLKWFRRDAYPIGKHSQVVYPGNVDMKGISLLVTLFTVFLQLVRWNRAHKQQPRAVVFYNYRLETALPAILFKMLFRVPLVIEYEDGIYAVTETNRHYKKISVAVEKFANRLLDGAVLVTSVLKKRVSTDNYTVVRGGTVHPAQLKPVQQVELGTDRPLRMVYSGRLDYDRGIEILLDALPYIQTTRPLELYITGYGPVEDKLKRFIQEFYHDHIQIKFHGFLDDHEYGQLMETADLFVNTQREQIAFSECSFPSKVVEYIKYGKLVLTSGVSDINTINQQMFVTYDNDDPRSLAASLNDILAHPQQYSLYPVRAMEWLVSDCAHEVVANKLNRVLSKAIDRTPDTTVYSSESAPAE